MIKELVKKANELNSLLLSENIARQDIKETDDYRNLAEQIENLSLQQQELLKYVPDSSVDLAGVKQDIKKYFIEEEIEVYDNIFAQFKEKKSVSTAGVLDALGGDIDTFASVATITQKNLKVLAKEDSYKPIKKALLGCIRVDSKEMIDVQIKNLI